VRRSKVFGKQKIMLSLKLTLVADFALIGPVMRAVRKDAALAPISFRIHSHFCS
jgi:hypothetical protein